MIKKFSISSIFAQLLLLIFVFVWIAPTFGLFISSLRDKDVLAISGWWTSFTTTDVNEIYRTEGMESQVEENGYFIIKGKAFEEGSETMSKEANSQLAIRQEKFIRDLKNALMRIENKTYGVCRVTGKLINKERLKLVPHATLSIEAKNMQR